MDMPQNQRIGIFLDADGVLWSDNGPGEILNPDNLEESKLRLSNFLRLLENRSSFFITVITNQTFAARGEIPYLFFRRQVNRNLKNLINNEFIDHFDVCFHHPHAQNFYLRRKNCKYRKPNPGMLLRTIKRYRLQEKKSVVIGDRITDIAAGNAAGLLNKILLINEKSLEVNRSFLGASEVGNFLDFNICNDLDEAARMINDWYHRD
jgi:D-glycero-D-manno-heptose 1,7-bisphosphate phosphatase